MKAWLARIAMACALATSASTDEALAATAGRWLPDHYPPGADQPVTAMAIHRDRLYLAGAFTRIGNVLSRHIAEWDGAQWSAVGAPLVFSYRDEINALVSYSGDLVAGGSFQLEEGAPDTHIARWDGRSWTGIGAGFDQDVRALLVHDGWLVAAGAFSHSGDDSCAGIAIWDGGRWRAPGGGVRGIVTALAGYRGNLIAGGNMSPAGTTYGWSVAAWDGRSWSPLGGRFSSSVEALCVFRDRLYAGGYFGLRVWDGVRWSTFENGPGSVSGLAVAGGRLIVSGSLDWIGDLYTGGLAGWDGSAWSSFAPGFRFGECRAFADYRGELFVGGNFDMGTPVQSRYLARWDGESWQAAGGHAFSNDLAPRVVGGRLVAVPASDGRGDPPSACIYEEEDGAWHPILPPVFGRTPVISDVVDFGGAMVVSGQFFQAGDFVVDDFAAWNGTSWTDFGAHLDEEASVGALTVYDGDLVIAGALGQVGGVPAERVGRWDGMAWQDMSAGVDLPLTDFLSLNDTLFARAARGYPEGDALLSWDGAAWQFLPGFAESSSVNPDSVGVIEDLSATTVHQGRLVISGLVSVGPDSSARKVLARTPAGWESLGELTGGSYQAITALASYHGDLIAGGYFNEVNEVPVYNLARWNGITWEAMDGIAEGGVSRLLVVGDTLIVDGYFRSLDGRMADGLGAWTDGAVNPDTLPPFLTLGVHAEPLAGRALDIYLTSSETLLPDSATISLDGVSLATMLPDPRIACARATIDPGAGITHRLSARALDRSGNAATTARDFTATPLIAHRDAAVTSPDGRLTVAIEGPTLVRSGVAIVAQDRGTRDEHDEYEVEPGAGNDGARMTLAIRWPDQSRAGLTAGGGSLLAIQDVEGGRLPCVIDTVTRVVRTTVRGGGRFRLVTAPPGWSTFATPAAVFEVGRATPDPFGPAVSSGSAAGTRFEFALPAPGRLRVRVHDVRGRAVATLLDEARPAGSQHLAWDGRDDRGRPVAAGVYLVAFDFAERRAVRKVVVSP